MEMLAVVLFTDALVGLRDVHQQATAAGYFLEKYALRYLGLALLVIASQRELSLGKVRPDALLQAFLLLALAALLKHLATGKLRYAALMGVALGCAYLTKSFAFLFAFLCIAVLALFRWLWSRQKLVAVVPATVLALVTFGVVAGPYVAALSHQKGRLDFGDSGSLNYAWYVGGTEKMHLQPYQTAQFGSADVHLKHPEKELLHSPLILSYAEMAHGTYPDWFDTTYWNDQIKPHFKLREDIPRVIRNCELVVRYLFNHPEALILLGLFVAVGARPALTWSVRKPGTNAFWLAPVALGAAAWGIYGIVNTEERYVTFAYLCIILPLFATLRSRASSDSPASRRAYLPAPYALLPLLLALLATGESLRTVLEDRRQLSGAHLPGGWYSPAMEGTAEALHAMGVQPGSAVACVGVSACLHDFYWARLAGVRILTEIYDQDMPVPVFLADLPNRDQAIAVVRGQGAKVLVGDFGDLRASDLNPEFNHWKQLAGTTYYALPLN
jgi:hypothetical protein